jgi:L-seryl-tRNA(Ser) seleniumtransferase
MLVALTGAEDAMVVNNNAAAVVLALSALAKRRDVLVSRGELIEIGGEFRLPDIMAASGARLVEVGTTNRTRATDFRRALGPRTGLILKVHPSNYRVVGFTGSVELAELASVAGEVGVPLLYDLGSGLLERYREMPAVVEALAGGADLVAFSGDKLLGGPQAGILAGRADLIRRLRRHPLARALRVDKMTVAALEAVLRLYVTDRRDEIPLWSMFALTQRGLAQRARGLAVSLPGSAVRLQEATVGGGSLPGYGVPSAQLVVPAERPERLAARLRVSRPPVFCRVAEDALVFDLRAVPPELDEALLRAIRYAFEQG